MLTVVLRTELLKPELETESEIKTELEPEIHTENYVKKLN